MTSMSRVLGALMVVSWIAGCTNPKSGPLTIGKADAGDEPPDDPGKKPAAAGLSDAGTDATVASNAADAAAPDMAPATSPEAGPPPPDLATLGPDLPPDLAPPPDLGPCSGQAPPAYGLGCGCNGGGKIACDGTCSEPDSTCTPTGQWYRLSNTFLGDQKVLDTFGGAPPNQAFINAPCCSGSMWKIVAVAGGFYRLTNSFLGDTRSLEAQPDGARLFLGDTGDKPAQLWSIRAAGKGIFRITNQALGPSRSLDVTNDAKNDPTLGKTGNYTGQLWKLTKVP
jgi:hypothetical protein